ncbi:hypothetical protein AB0B45_48070 [Nonomuraea sp. NPDC049152]|uniref:hypothetical protein n=1 Tax=Nonomuraea sp. NPDC049152 TaxID=3154350 RepID=UPI0033FEA21F
MHAGRALPYGLETGLETLASRTPSGRLSTPVDVAELISFLGSTANRDLSEKIIREGRSTGRTGQLM